MSRIKTRENVNSIKTLDKAAVASERMKQAAIRAKKNASAFTNDRSCSPEEYAQEKLQYGMEDIGRGVTHGTVMSATYTVRRGKELFQKQHEKKQFEKRQAEKEYKANSQEQNSFCENWSESEPGRQQNEKPNQGQRKASVQRKSPQTCLGSDIQLGFPEEASSPQFRGRKLAIETAKKRNNKSQYVLGAQSVTHDNEIPSKADSPKGRIRVPNRTIKLSPRSSGSITVKTAPQANRPGSDIREIHGVRFILIVLIQIKKIIYIWTDIFMNFKGQLYQICLLCQI